MSLVRGKVVISFHVERDGLAVTRKMQPVDIGAHLPYTSNRHAKVTDCHIQRTAVQLRHGKAQLIIFTTGKRPAQPLLFLYMSAESV